MKVRKYTGATAYEAMTKLKSELGQDAIVLNTRTIRQKGFLGLFKKPIVEVTAAFEEKDLISKKTNTDNKWLEISNEIQDIKNLIEDFSTNTMEITNKIPRRLDHYKNILIDEGVEYSTATLIIREINEQININNKDDEVIRNIIKYSLMEYMGDIRPISIGLGQQKIIFCWPYWSR